LGTSRNLIGDIDLGLTYHKGSVVEQEVRENPANIDGSVDCTAMLSPINDTLVGVRSQVLRVCDTGIKVSLTAGSVRSNLVSFIR